MSSASSQPLNTVGDVRNVLHGALANIPSFERCAVLDHPSHFNIGDHLIWLGAMFYLRQTRKAKVDYIASAGQFSTAQFAARSREGPIFLHGGGNFGDIWPDLQNFREAIIGQYPNRKIVILPQTIHFSSSEKLKQSADLLNQHPDLTIFVRDDRSYQTAITNFSGCKVYKAPDAAFHLAGLPNTQLAPPQIDRTIYMCREDREMNYSFKPKNLGLHNSIVDDWVSFHWLRKLPENWIYVPGLTRFIREFWQRGLKQPHEWVSRQKWQWLHPYSRDLGGMYGSHLNRMSWGQAHSGIYQLQQYSGVITNRLHVHILCLLLGIPHVLLPGSYYKIEAFHREWTCGISLCQFAKTPDEVPAAIATLEASQPCRA